MMSKTVALVSGGSSGLGAAAVRRMVAQGARVLVADLPSQSVKYQELAQNLPNSSVTFCETDVTDPNQVTASLDEVEKVFGEPLNVAVNCAGIAIAQKTLSRKGPHGTDGFSKVLQVNTVGSFTVGTLAAERMSGRDADGDGLRGCIINTASIAAYEGQIGQVAYAASKGAIVGMTLPMARDLAGYGIRVMSIAPGLFATPLLDGLPENVKAELGATVPCPSRLGEPDEFGDLVVSIVQNPFLNGSVIRLDGALRMPP